MTLNEIKDRIAKFQVVQCDMYHERVAFDPATRLPLKRQVGSEQWYQRVSLCAEQERDYRLGCAHSKANDAFAGIVEELVKNDLTFTGIKEQLVATLLRIYQLDWQKGDLERAYAEQLEQGSNHSARQKEIQEQIASVIQQHRECIQDLESIKARLLLKVEALFEN